MELNSDQLQKLNRGRTLRIALPPLLDLLGEEIENALNRLVGDFRNGKTEFIGHAAELATLINLRDTLLREEQDTTSMEATLHGNG
jgi:hypothetical protein